MQRAAVRIIKEWPREDWADDVRVREHAGHALLVRVPCHQLYSRNPEDSKENVRVRGEKQNITASPTRVAICQSASGCQPIAPTPRATRMAASMTKNGIMGNAHCRPIGLNRNA